MHRANSVMRHTADLAVFGYCFFLWLAMCLRGYDPFFMGATDQETLSPASKICRSG